jgi:hypothetical protein
VSTFAEAVGNMRFQVIQKAFSILFSLHFAGPVCYQLTVYTASSHSSH